MLDKRRTVPVCKKIAIAVLHEVGVEELYMAMQGVLAARSERAALTRTMSKFRKTWTEERELDQFRVYNCKVHTHKYSGVGYHDISSRVALSGGAHVRSSPSVS